MQDGIRKIAAACTAPQSCIKSEGKTVKVEGESENSDESESVWDEENEEGNTLMWDGTRKIAAACSAPKLHRKWKL